jgi:sporulation protein YlmC with PRC-barrel domain
MRGTLPAALRGGWRASELIRRPVVDVRLGQHLGEVGDIVFDPEGRRIVGLLMQGRGRDGVVLQVARRAFGGTLGLTYLDVERIISLHADMVTIQSEAEPNGQSPVGDPMPRLSAFLDFAVISIQGRRFGRFADLLLGSNGRTVVGYLIRPREDGAAAHDARAAGPVASAQQVSQPYPPDDDSAGIEAPSQDAVATPAPALLVIPAGQDVRFGRDLIVVAWRYDSARRERPVAEERSADWPAEAGELDDIVDTPTWQHWESEAPTEQVRH